MVSKAALNPSSAHWVDVCEAEVAKSLWKAPHPIAEIGRLSHLTGLGLQEVVLLSRREDDGSSKPETTVAQLYHTGTLEQQMTVRMLLGEIPGDPAVYGKCRDRAARAAWYRAKRRP